jgi:hypothetical protein
VTDHDDALQSLQAAALGEGVIGAAVSRVYTLAREGGPRVATGFLAKLDPVLRAAPVDTVGNVGLLAGALVELGATGAVFPTSLFDRIGAFLDEVPEPSSRPHTDDDEDEEEEPDMPEPYYMLERAAASLLSRSADMRRGLPQKAALLGKIRRYQERYGFLGKMLQVLDDEALLVAHPSTHRAWRARIGGIADNFQLHALLRSALAGPGDNRIPGTPPDPRSVSAFRDGPTEDAPPTESDWQLVQWRAVQPDGSIPGQNDASQWIWNEGFPAEIERFEGTRLVAIGPSTIQRSWNSARIFHPMHGWVAVDRKLSKDEAHGLLARIAAARAGA